MAWGMTNRKTPAPQEVKSGRFELEQDGQVAYLEYRLSPHVLELIHTEVPEPLRGKGVAASLAESALKWARENKRRVDVICPSVLDFVAKHPEYSDLIMR